MLAVYDESILYRYMNSATISSLPDNSIIWFHGSHFGNGIRGDHWIDLIRISGSYQVANTTTNAVTTVSVDQARITDIEDSVDSDNRSGRHAKYFTFTITETTTVTIEMLSSELDPYIYLLDGNRGADILMENDDVNDNSLTAILSDIELEAGTYTVECTTFGAGDTGEFRILITD